MPRIRLRAGKWVLSASARIEKRMTPEQEAALEAEIHATSEALARRWRDELVRIERNYPDKGDA